MSASLFISYSHRDQQVLHAVQQHLEGMLFGRASVWTDAGIAKGVSWEDQLRGGLRQVTAGLVLASPDYLISNWCRTELASLVEAHRRGRVRKVYWLLVRPCGWKLTELKDLQAVQDSATLALLDVPDGPQREAYLLEWCQTIARGVLNVVDGDCPEVTLTRQILARSEHYRDIELAPDPDLRTGAFSFVCRGVRSNGDDVMIKVLTHSPLRHMRKRFRAVCERCKLFEANPTIVRVIDVFVDGEGYDERLVILSERARGEHLDKVIEKDPDHFDPDTVRLILLRIASALETLHKTKPLAEDPHYVFMHGPLLPASIFYDKATKRPQISLVSVTNFLWQSFSPEALKVIAPHCDVDALPERFGKRPSDEHTDDKSATSVDAYFLGKLALQLLEASERAKAPAKEMPQSVASSSGCWTRHEQLCELLNRLLEGSPTKFRDMDELIRQLRAVEEWERALAKHSYRTYVRNDADFAAKFYMRLFESHEKLQMREHFERAHRNRGEPFDGVPSPAQMKKLISSLSLVLNFRDGSKPWGIDEFAREHTKFALERTHFHAFKKSFIEQLRCAMKGQEEANGAEAICDAWNKLFDPVIQAFQKVMLEGASGMAPVTRTGFTQEEQAVQSGGLPTASVIHATTSVGLNPPT